MNSQTLILEQETIFYTIVYSERKTLSIRMTENGELEVRAPRRMKQKEMEGFLLEKQDWIIKHKKSAEKKQDEEPLFEWKNGAEVSIAGKSYQLEIKEIPNARQDIVRLIEQRIVMTTNDTSTENVKRVVTFWFKKACKPLIVHRVSVFAAKMGVSYGRITLKEQKSCWGSCSSKENINLNWKILLMPPEIMDYVIVHELSHRKEMNHSKAFWDIVEKELPDYRKHRKWLKERGYLYTRI